MTRIVFATLLALAACKDTVPAAPEVKAAAPAQKALEPEVKAPEPLKDSVVDGVRVVEMRVTKKGYEPSPLTVKKGEPLKLLITRTEARTCATEIVVPGYDINTPLPLNEEVTVEFTPKEAGELKYGCAMNLMIAGVLVVE